MRMSTHAVPDADLTGDAAGPAEAARKQLPAEAPSLASLTDFAAEVLAGNVSTSYEASAEDRPRKKRRKGRSGAGCSLRCRRQHFFRPLTCVTASHCSGLNWQCCFRPVIVFAASWS